MKKVAKKKGEGDGSAIQHPLRGLFQSFAKLAEQAAEGRAQLRGLRVAYDPKGDRFVVVHIGSRVEFVLRLDGESLPAQAEVECRRMDSAGVTEKAIIARFKVSDTGVVSESTIAELDNERIDQAPGAWSIVAAIMWSALLPSA
jgi:hypothetical protein